MARSATPTGAGIAARSDDALTIFERSAPGRDASRMPLPRDDGAAVAALPAHLLRREPPQLPEVAESQLVRHYVRLSQRNASIDTLFYPLGSCTMKYNPKANERIAAMPGFADLHPWQSAEDSQGTLELLWRLQRYLGELSGLGGVTLQPAAGAQGEFAGLLIMRAFHRHRKDLGRIEHEPTHVIIPDTAHGTNPASVTMAGYQTLPVRTDERGGMDIEDMQRKMEGVAVAGLMLTNPNTLGLLDENIEQIARLVHRAGGLLYYDGANFNAIMGKCRPGDMGFDIVHFNTHKSFSTPHGGGGPGAGPLAVRVKLMEYLPSPQIVRSDDGLFRLVATGPRSIGQVKQFWGNIGVLVRAYAYIAACGRDGLQRTSEMAVLNANYLLQRLAPAFEPAFDRTCMHEFVVSAAALKRDYGVRALDVAKRLMDYGFHPPTVYFPLLVDEALMIEPTETETPETLDRFAEAMQMIAAEAASNPDLVTGAPHTTPLRRVDEARAARDQVLALPRPDSPVSATRPTLTAAR